MPIKLLLHIFSKLNIKACYAKPEFNYLQGL